MSIAHRAAPWPRMHAPSRGPPPARPPASGVDLTDRLEQRGKTAAIVVGRLAVEPVRVALPHPDDAREAVVAQLDDDGRTRLPESWSVRAIRNGSRSASRSTSWVR